MIKIIIINNINDILTKIDVIIFDKKHEHMIGWGLLFTDLL